MANAFRTESTSNGQDDSADDHPDFDNDGVWPRRLLHVPTMTSHKWQPGNTYGGHSNPKYNALSYTWGRWRLKSNVEMPEIRSLNVHDVKWSIPRIRPDHFTVADFQDAIHSTLQAVKLSDSDQSLGEFLWLDVACIDQRNTRFSKAEIGRQARIFRRAATVYVWLSHHSRASLSLINTELMEAKSSAGGFLRYEKTSIYPRWCQETLKTVESLCTDPWFSSLWTLQEAFLCPNAVIMSKEGHCINETPYEGFLQLKFLAYRGHSIELAIRQSPRFFGSNDIPASQKLKMVLNESGLSALSHENAMGALVAARYRETEFELDRIYGIMQIFGDSFKIGETKTPDIPCPRSPSLSDLEDEFGALLVEHHQSKSQLFVHDSAPPVGKGWRISSCCYIPWFAESIIHWPVRPSKPQLGCVFSVCKLSTTPLLGVLWGCFSGKACTFATLQTALLRQSILNGYTDHDTVYWEPTLSLTLDNIAVTQKLLKDRPTPRDPKIAFQSGPMDAEEQSFAEQVAIHFHDQRLIVFMLAQEATSAYNKEGAEPYFDQSYGMLLMEQSMGPFTYWHRIGICRWRKLANVLGEDDHDNQEVLLGLGPAWQQMKRFFG
ncbi:hypothetical protein BDZ45DRAFT_264044 [Acephala macrosclerotiorum]|nr:hypothetical protein BDZ45DRAFT_264044 [Acephala macrosclerotiorum]